MWKIKPALTTEKVINDFDLYCNNCKYDLEGEYMITVDGISQITGLSREEVINRGLISFIEIEIRLAEMDIADVRERYNVLSKEDLYEAIKGRKIESHPAWEDYIVWKNKEKYIEDLKEQAKSVNDI
ncbi:hypothetical protein [Methanoplanus endosymbiosus]|uniref:Uncharacterized protein n=1 Tax=Methanoplanus endosymbiosus TaxID=33865 RepID=A0A9E7PNF2_9EURY|nr:hypothetical protein [Methanoplanus endosymbiosus]UUX92522.1 hypothetical protein L6E24_14500 [Methanoplanus endosymbiosus]